MNSLQQRTYSGKYFRPKPKIIVENQSQSTLIATSWNSPDAAEKVLDMMRDFLSTVADPEATTAGPYIEGLGTIGNRLRSAALYANENLWLSENRSEYVAGVELASFSLQKNILSWVQIGAPHLLLVNEQGFQPLCYTPDWAWQIQQDTPLLCQSLGIEKTVHLNCGSYRLQGNEKIVMVSRSQIPAKFYTQKKIQLDSLAEVLVQDASETPFWIGLLEI